MGKRIIVFIAPVGHFVGVAVVCWLTNIFLPIPFWMCAVWGYANYTVICILAQADVWIMDKTLAGQPLWNAICEYYWKFVLYKAIRWNVSGVCLFLFSWAIIFDRQPVGLFAVCLFGIVQIVGEITKPFFKA